VTNSSRHLRASKLNASLTFAQLLALELNRPEPEDRLLAVQEAAPILGVTVDWLYRHADEFRFTVRPGAGQLRFSSIGIQDYLRRERR
jgi:predicted DNA-binding transcriptional regulator AlpA